MTNRETARKLRANIEKANRKATSEPAKGGEKETTLDKMGHPALVAMATALGIEVKRGATKAQLRELIEAANEAKKGE